MATTKKEPFGGRQAPPFGKKGEKDKDEKKPVKTSSKKTSRGK